MNFFAQGNGLEYLPAFATSLAVGLLVGVERERSPAAKAGLRTFALVSMLGTLLALLSEKMDSAWILASGIIAIGAMIISSYLDDDEDEDPGTTTTAALLFCMGLGAIIWYGYSTLAIMLAITTTGLLHYKPELQSMTKSLTRADLQSMLQFAVLSFIILPILPNQDFGPYQTLNPYQTWWMVVLISGVSLAGYVALRVVGQRYGAPLLGVLGGMASSTATTMVYAHHAQNRDMINMAAVVITIANLVVLVRLGVISGVVSPHILPALLPVFASGALFGGLGAIYLWRRMSTGVGTLPMPEIKNPTEIKVALGFGLLYTVVSLIASWMSDVAGSQGLYLLAFVSGLTDVDAIFLTSLRLFEQGKLVPDQTVLTIVIAYLSNLAFKFGFVVVVGGRELAKRCALGAGAVAVGMLVGVLLFRSVTII